MSAIDPSSCIATANLHGIANPDIALRQICPELDFVSETNGF
jgi:hypothetical protein